MRLIYTFYLIWYDKMIFPCTKRLKCLVFAICHAWYSCICHMPRSSQHAFYLIRYDNIYCHLQKGLNILYLPYATLEMSSICHIPRSSQHVWRSHQSERHILRQPGVELGTARLCSVNRQGWSACHTDPTGLRTFRGKLAAWLLHFYFLKPFKCLPLIS